MNAEREANRARPGAPTGAAPGWAERRAAGVPAAPGSLAVSEGRCDPPGQRLFTAQRWQPSAQSCMASLSLGVVAAPDPGRPSSVDPSDAGAASAVTVVFLRHILPAIKKKKVHGRPRLRGQSPPARAAPGLPGLLVRGQRLLGGGRRQSPASAEPPRPATDGYHCGLRGA